MFTYLTLGGGGGGTITDAIETNEQFITVASNCYDSGLCLPNHFLVLKSVCCHNLSLTEHFRMSANFHKSP